MSNFHYKPIGLKSGISGIRGIYPVVLDSHLAVRYAIAFHRYLPEGVIIVGRDTRQSGADLLSIIIDTLIEAGREVKDCEITPTPTIQFLVGDTDAVGGIIVTASHNQEDWNGMKFINDNGCFLNRTQFESFLRLFEEDLGLNSSELGVYSKVDQPICSHVQRILSLDFLDVIGMKSRQFTVAVDAFNGAASESLPYLLRSLGCKVVKINCEFSGKFARRTEPVPENLDMLACAVRENRCDIGFATDPDGDRLAIVDEGGNPLGEEYTLVLALNDFLQSVESPQTIVTNISTTMAVDKIVKKYGGVVKRSSVGEINVVELMKRENARIGGEGNGSVILRDVHFCRDSMVGAAIVLNLMCKSLEPISAIFANLPQFQMLKDSIPLRKIDLNKISDSLAPIFEDAIVDRSDGLKFLWKDRWIHVRKSNTEHIVRIYAEALDKENAQALIEPVKKLLISFNEE